MTRAIVSAVLYVLAMALPTFSAGGGRGSIGYGYGHDAFRVAFMGFADEWPCALGAVANVLHLSALGLGLLGAPRGVRTALAGLATACAIACGLGVHELLRFPGWWVWTGSMGVLAATREGLGDVPAWFVASADGIRGEVERVAALALPVAGLFAAVGARIAVHLVPEGVLVPPALAAAGSAALAATLLAVAARLRWRVPSRVRPRP